MRKKKEAVLMTDRESISTLRASSSSSSSGQIILGIPARRETKPSEVAGEGDGRGGLGFGVKVLRVYVSGCRS